MSANRLKARRSRPRGVFYGFCSSSFSPVGQRS